MALRSVILIINNNNNIIISRDINTLDKVRERG